MRHALLFSVFSIILNGFVSVRSEAQTSQESGNCYRPNIPMLNTQRLSGNGEFFYESPGLVQHNRIIESLNRQCLTDGTDFIREVFANREFVRVSEQILANEYTLVGCSALVEGLSDDTICKKIVQKNELPQGVLAQIAYYSGVGKGVSVESKGPIVVADDGELASTGQGFGLSYLIGRPSVRRLGGNLVNVVLNGKVVANGNLNEKGEAVGIWNFYNSKSELVKKETFDPTVNDVTAGATQDEMTCFVPYRANNIPFFIEIKNGKLHYREGTLRGIRLQGEFDYPNYSLRNAPTCQDLTVLAANHAQRQLLARLDRNVELCFLNVSDPEGEFVRDRASAERSLKTTLTALDKFVLPAAWNGNERLELTEYSEKIRGRIKCSEQTTQLRDLALQLWIGGDYKSAEGMFVNSENIINSILEPRTTGRSSRGSN